MYSIVVQVTVLGIVAQAEHPDHADADLPLHGHEPQIPSEYHKLFQFVLNLSSPLIF